MFVNYVVGQVIISYSLCFYAGLHGRGMLMSFTIVTGFSVFYNFIVLQFCNWEDGDRADNNVSKLSMLCSIEQFHQSFFSCSHSKTHKQSYNINFI